MEGGAVMRRGSLHAEDTLEQVGAPADVTARIEILMFTMINAPI